VLLRRRQNNPILTGEAGVGKTAIVEGFAQRLAAGEVPPKLKGTKLYELDIQAMQAGASMKGEFEQRLKSVIDEVQSSPTPIILFIDEAHTLIGAGGAQGTGDAANLLKPALARGTLRTIAAQFGTTWEVLAAYNNLANPNYIQAGMVISIPPAGYVPPTPPATGGPVTAQPPATDVVVAQPVSITYVVQAGDTLSEIAAYFGVTVESIRAYNAITNNRLIFPGDVLIIPPTGGPVVVQPQPTVPRTVYNGYYIVRAGDTMFAIAASFGVNVYDLAEVNGILNLNAIYVGQALLIPGY